ncbi:MAG TPA: trypsin-like serine protease [Solirubrobacterales bacterium]|nr:trypsin-like serine protease [Solirubrobacterales bacterium]
MPSRTARVGLALICAAGLLMSVAAGSAAAKVPRAKASIVGGTPASISEWGFITAILTPHTLCTGSVISPTRVLTAAHCLSSPSTMTVRTGSNLAFAGGSVHAVSSAAVNSGWNHGFIGDLAVLTLSNPTSAPPIQLGSATEDSAYTGPRAALSVAGFGARNPSPRRKPKIGLLTEATVFVRGFCPLPTSLMCDAGKRSGLIAIAKVKRKLRKRPIQKTVCAGDSGGPMVAATPAGLRLVGIAEATAAPPKRSAFGFVWCGLKGFPAIHTRVASWLSFIQGS